MKNILHKIPLFGIVSLCALAGANQSVAGQETQKYDLNMRDTVSVVGYSEASISNSEIFVLLDKYGEYLYADQLYYSDDVKVPEIGEKIIVQRLEKNRDEFVVVKNLGTQQKQRKKLKCK